MEGLQDFVLGHDRSGHLILDCYRAHLNLPMLASQIRLRQDCQWWPWKLYRFDEVLVRQCWIQHWHRCLHHRNAHPTSQEPQPTYTQQDCPLRPLHPRNLVSPSLPKSESLRLTLHSVCVTSILRFTTLNIATAHTDVMWQSIPSSMWTVIEYNLGIIAASIPALRRPLATLFPRILGRTSGSSGNRLPSDDLYTRHPRVPSTVSTASTKHSWPLRSSHRDQQDDTYDHSLFEEKDDRYRSGMRTEIFENSDIDVSEKAMKAVNDGVPMPERSYQNNEIVKTVEFDVRPGSSRRNSAQYKLFPT